MICSCLCVRVCICVFTYEGGDAASTDGGLEVTLQLLLDGAGGVKALSQQDDGVHKEEGANAIDDVLKNLNPEQKQRQSKELALNIKVIRTCTKETLS